MTIVRGNDDAGAIFSDDMRYRFSLWRIWEPTRKVCNFVMLNPSTADENVLDPTVRRCVGYAKMWGYGGLWVTNIFALRSTDPMALRNDPDPVGADNDWHIKTAELHDSLVVAAWGVHGALHGRGNFVKSSLSSEAKCLGFTKDGHPRHPLYLRADTPREDLHG